MQHRKLLFCSFFALTLAPLAWVMATNNHSKSASTKAAAPVATVVQVATVSQTNVPQTISALGSLSAVNIVVLSAQADGRVSTINFRNGQTVEKGMPVVQFDDSQTHAIYQEKKTALALAQKQYEAHLKLKNFAVSIQDLQTLKAAVATAQAQANSAFAAWQQMKVAAPFTGVLGAFKVNQGDFVSAGSPIVTLVDSKQLRVDFTVPEIYFPKLKQEQLVTVSVSAYPDKKFFGTVSFISPTVARATRSIAVQALVPNLKDYLSPGMFVQVTQQIGVLKNVMVVPDQAVSIDVKGNFVYTVANSKVSKVYIKMGQHQGANVQVLSGLRLGESVVITGQQKIEDGSIVQIQK